MSAYDNPYGYDDWQDNGDCYSRPVKAPNCMASCEDYVWSMPEGCEDCDNQNPHACEGCSVMR